MFNFTYENSHCILIYLFNNTFSDLHNTLSNCKMISEELIRNNVTGSAHGLVGGTVTEFVWND
jgi:hypothetical protein